MVWFGTTYSNIPGDGSFADGTGFIISPLSISMMAAAAGKFL